jgi:hypothetical protein
MRSIIAVGWVVVLVGCVVEEEDETGEVVQALSRPCPIYECATNSPEIDHLGIHDLSETGLVNATGFRLLSFKKGAVTYSLDVTSGKIRGMHPTLTPLKGAALAGAIITVRNDHTLLTYSIRITAVGNAPYWASTGVPKVVETYLLEWVTNGVGQPVYRNICTNPPFNDPEAALGMNAFHTLVFEGERIDATTKVITNASSTWFNLGCAGHALAKLALTGHTKAAAANGFVTTLDERQTMIRMLIGDYCGRGIPFTIAGEPLGWKDDHGWMAYPPTIVPGLEARWTPNGARCLEEPRLQVTTHPQMAIAFPEGIDAAIAAECARPPTCTSLGESGNADDLEGAHLVSANPL